MFIVENYSLAVVFCIVTMLCWGSWGNTQKLAAKTWRYELFYWDYVIGILLLSLISGFTLGSTGEQGRPFLTDLLQADRASIVSAVIGGIIFNASNLLLSASISIAGLAVAFPIGVGIALALGVFINYFEMPQGDPVILFIGVSLVVVAILINGIAAGKTQSGAGLSRKKGIVLAIISGVLMAFFYRFVAAAMDMNFQSPASGKFTPYSAFFVFAIGILLSNFIFNTLVMKKPFVGTPVSYKAYFKGNLSTHCVGLLGGVIWAIGTELSYIAAGVAGTAISYGLGQGATMVAAFWGVFIWKEFRGSGKLVRKLLTLMFVLFIAGLSMIVLAGNVSAEVQKRPINIIFETDMGNDVDDAMALDLLYKGMDDHKINLLAVMSNKDNKYSTEYIDILNTWYGYPEIPVGRIVSGTDTIDEAVNYTKTVCLMKDEKGGPYYVRTKNENKLLPEATKLYRKILAQQADTSVTIVSVGFSTNIVRLLATPPDEISPLSGKDLIAKKVKLLSVMAGSFGEKAIAEFNVRTDISAAKTLFTSWPTPIVVAPFETGLAVEYPATSIMNDFKWSKEKHPLIEAYKVYLPMPYDRPTWDLIATLYVLNPSDKFFTRTCWGIISIDDKGFSTFVAKKDGNHAFLSMTPAQAAATRDSFIKEITRKPANK